MNCTVDGCGARAWHGELCNYHALQAVRRAHQSKPQAEHQVQSGQRKLKEDAERLGIELAESAEEVTLTQPNRKVRSPVV